ncbi:IS3 family transposase, partial [Arenicella sp. 4NH20-0111]|uniref:IS3 family transposase n=1 Tax=Arenicella sp. 4NH20-0111 TaxID=3127648 RepID=UPI0033416DD3
MQVNPSGYYDWLREPQSRREQEDKRLTVFIKQFWLESGCHFGYRNIHQDLMEAKILCGRDRVLRLMRQAGLEAQRGYGKPKNMYAGKPHTLI